MQGVISGKDVMFWIKNGDVFQPYVCAKDLTITPTATLIQVATVGDGPWDKFKYQSIGYSITMSSVVRIGDDVFSAFEMLLRMMNFLEVEYKIEFESQDGEAKIIRGTVLIESNPITANAGQLVLTDVTLRGSGKPRITDCDASIIAATVETDFGDAVVSITAVEGFPLIYYYQIDSEIEIESDQTTLRFSSVPEGYHTITVTPACASGNRGDSIMLDWANVANPTNPTCGVPGGFALTEVTETSMIVNWSAGLNNTSVDISLKNLSTGAVVNHTNLPGTTANITDLLPGATYAVTIQANCGDQKSATISQNRTMPNSGPRPRIFIKNFSSNVRVQSVSVNGSVAFSTVVDINSTNDFEIDPGVYEIALELNKIDDFDASATVQNSGRRLCLNVNTAGVTNPTFGTFSIGTEGLEININSFACTG